MTKQKVLLAIREVFSFTCVALLSVSCASGYNQPKQQQARGLTETELAYKVRELQIILDGALRTGNIYEAQSAAGLLGQLAISYPQVCPVALDADLKVRNMGAPPPAYGLIQQECQGYR